ncbi:MAG: hypothetical protein ABI967_09360 [bacterium]
MQVTKEGKAIAANVSGRGMTQPRWPAVLATLALGGIYSALPAPLLITGRRELVLLVVIALLVPTIITHKRGNHFLNQVFGFVLDSVVTIALIWSLELLLAAVLRHEITPPQLLKSAAVLWIANVLVFASWYWHLDGGGPHERSLTPGHSDGAFLFPQMSMNPEAKIAAGEHLWEPNFIDYLFLAFNTSTAFSPTDVPVLSRWAKIMMMTQSLISLLVIALLAGRAVNIL